MRRRSAATVLVVVALFSAVVTMTGCRETVVGQAPVSSSTASLPTTGTVESSATSTPAGSVTPSQTLGGLATTSPAGGSAGGPSTGAVGQTVSAGAWTMRVLGTEFVKNINGQAVPSGQALKVTAQFKNPTKNTYDLATYLALQAGIKAVAPSPKGGAANVPGGQNINVTVYFPVDTQGTGYRLIFTEPGGGKGKAMVKLN